MTQETQKGIGLRPSRNPKECSSGWLMKSMVSAMASVVLAMAGADLVGFTAGNVTMLMVSLMLCTAYGLLARIRKEAWFFMGTLGIALFMVLFFRSFLVEGFRIIWNQAGDTLLECTGMVIPAWELRFGTQGETICAVLFAGFCSVGISLVCCVLVSVSPGILAGLLPVALLAGTAWLGESGDPVWLMPVLGTSVLIFLYGGWKRSGPAAPVLVSWCVCVVIALLLLMGLSSQAIVAWADGVREEVCRGNHIRKYETLCTILPEGKYTDYKATGQNAEQALAVTMELPQQMYLRGFTGAVFTGSVWEPLEKEALVDNKQLLYWLNKNAFDLNAQYEAAAAALDLERGTVTVQNIGACSFYRYVPFSIVGGTWCQAENLNTDGVYAGGERSYAYSVTEGTGESILRVLEHLQTSDDPQVLAYRQAESAYRRFVYHYYLQIPQEVLDLLQELWDQIAVPYGGVDNLTNQQAQDCALVFLEACFPEEGTPEEWTLPLEHADGSAYQYATVVAMTLRYFGIPTRYAEGYIISREMAEGTTSGETLVIAGSCAGAWVEVYQDGIGWIPMSLAPGMGEVLENPDKEGFKSNASNRNQQEQQEPEKEPEPEGGTLVSLLLKSAFVAVLGGMLLSVLLFLLCALRRNHRMKQLTRRYCENACRESAAWIYADTVTLLEQMGFHRGNGSMRSLHTPLEEKHGKEFAELFDRATDLNDRAVFSSGQMEESQREELLEFRNQTLQKLRADVKWYRRWWLKWVRCLY